jgi:hypothetical protein
MRAFCMFVCTPLPRTPGPSPALAISVVLPERILAVAPSDTTFALVSTANLQAPGLEQARDKAALLAAVSSGSTQAWLDALFTGCGPSQVRP